MNKISKAYNDVRHIEEYGDINSFVHHLNPLLKIIVTLLFIIFVLSTPTLDLIELLSYLIIIGIISVCSHIKISSILKRSLIGLPLSLCLGLSNLFLLSDSINYFGFNVRLGLISFIAIMLKTLLCLSITFLLIATTKFDVIASELVHIKVPAIFVLQLIMTYRYIFVLIDEAGTMSRAYGLRHPTSKAIDFKDMGSFVGSLLIRSFKQSNDIYDAMKCRGFNIKTTYTRYVKFESENYFLLMMILAFMIIIKVVV